ncbi:MurR/RpiR family transcriptional regulator [Robertmurraya kyonggiensis]|uniref:MurR/RpiR family transcriptional regulator n=1 Tax=Robertmurraya kyonggiensis TaxID=1037680 RepID=A0A4U1D311_9BACI|nr:MurR/RpiR family transcriptional regulator [Robertmurraya kyonggiensis]TKC16123.1 MurR/RpiR family transcriptional regulator [Robertmurraya kyonggiensis]
MISGGLKIIENMLGQLPESERKIAQYILQSPHDAVNCTVSELAAITESSGAAVIRLCKSLGFKGFQELKIRIISDLGKPVEQGYRDFERGEKSEDIVQKTLSNSIQSLRDSVEVIHYEELKKAVQALLTAKNVHFFGIGASHIIATDAQQKLLRIKKSSTAFSDTHLVATLIANAEPDDVLFGISFSGETPEVINVMALAKEQGMKTISLTKYGQSSVADLADMKLFTSHSAEAPFRSAATSSRLAQLFMIDILFLCMASEQFEETVDYIDKTRGAIQFLKDRSSN